MTSVQDVERTLEFDLFLEQQVARRCESAPGRDAARSARSAESAGAARELLLQTREAVAILRAGRAPRLRVKDDGLGLLARAEEQGIPLFARELATLFRFLRQAHELRQRLFEEDEAAALKRVAAGIPDLSALVRELEESVDEGGELLDTATARLRALRSEIAGRKEQVRRSLERYAHSPSVRPHLRSIHVAIRDDRYVLAVKTGARGQLKGLYHDRSATGNTVYLEPEHVVEDQNTLRDLRIDEDREVVRILWRFTHLLFARRDALEATQRQVAALDFALARGRLAADLDLVEPVLGDDGPLTVVDARHPLLLARAFDRAVEQGLAGRELRAALEDSVVPFSLALGDGFDLLVLTGPNTGGKTATLKALGLLALLPRCGCFVAAASARVPFFPSIFADIGDEQDLARSLSTFSGHVARIVAILREARRGSLVLLDELGTGTDPLEGEALATALLERLLERRVLAVATTHLGRLKELPARNPRAANASMQFDPETLRPTFRLLLGVPGSSNALSIARRLGLEARIVERAEQLQSTAGQRDRRLYAQLDRSRATLEKLKVDAERDRKSARDLTESLEKDRGEVDRARDALAMQAEQAAEARLRRFAEEIEEPRRQLLALGGKAALAAGRVLEALRRALAGSPLAEQRRTFARGLKPGDPVVLPRFNEVCRVRRVHPREDRVEVDYRSMSVTVGFDEIAPLPPGSLSGDVRPR